MIDPMAIARSLVLGRGWTYQEAHMTARDCVVVMAELSAHPEGLSRFEVELVCHRSHKAALRLIKVMVELGLVYTLGSGKTLKVVKLP
jgi:hypothetical protein